MLRKSSGGCRHGKVFHCGSQGEIGPNYPKGCGRKRKDNPYPSGQGTGGPGPHGRHEIPGRVGRSSGPGRSPGGLSRSQGESRTTHPLGKAQGRFGPVMAVGSLLTISEF